MRIDKSLGYAFLTGGMVGLAFGVTGCVDNNYDLSDIDKTVQVNVNDLVLPVKMKPVELHSLIDADSSDDPDGSEFRYDEETGNYYIQTSGEFNSDPIDIKGIYVSALTPETRSLTTPVANVSENLSEIPGISLEDLNYDFIYEFDEVDDYIKEIKSVKLKDFSIELKVNTSSPNVKLSNMLFHLPAGLVQDRITATDGSIPVYDPNTGLLSIHGSYQSTVVTIYVKEIMINEAGGKYDQDKSLFVFKNTLGLRDAEIKSSVVSPAETLSVQYSLSALEVTAVSGEISYNVEVDDSEISLSDLPDELRQDGTNLALVNPQIYLDITNPFAKYGVYARTGLAIYQMRNGSVSAEAAASLASVNLGGNAEEQRHQETLCLAPNKPAKPFETYTLFETFNRLGSVVAGNGLPDKLIVKLVKPCVPEGTPVVDFPIGRSAEDLEEVSGSYTFYAPLALKSGSTIKYTDSDTDWDMDDADDLYIDLLQVSADVTSDIPLEVSLRAYPLDADGNEISNIKVEPAVIPASSTASVVIAIKATDGTYIKGLDGLRYEAVVTADGSEQNLNKNMRLSLDNLRAKVNGYYKTTL